VRRLTTSELDRWGRVNDEARDGMVGRWFEQARKEQGVKIVGMVVCNNQLLHSEVGTSRFFKCMKPRLAFWSKHMFPEELLSNGRGRIIGVEGKVQVASLFCCPKGQEAASF
jgi:hypothetical protein